MTKDYMGREAGGLFRDGGPLRRLMRRLSPVYLFEQAPRWVVPTVFGLLLVVATSVVGRVFHADHTKREHKTAEQIKKERTEAYAESIRIQTEARLHLIRLQHEAMSVEISNDEETGTIRVRIVD